MFIGYLLFDALIGNSDRHHENWAVIERFGIEAQEPIFYLHLAPTYDHASSLGRNEQESRRAERLQTRDRGNTVEAYANRCASALYASTGDRKPLRTIEAFRSAAALRPRAAEAWQGRLSTVTEAQITHVMAEVPRERCSAIAEAFAMRIVLHNRARLLGDED